MGFRWMPDNEGSVITLRKHCKPAQCCKMPRVMPSGPPTPSPVTEMPARVSEVSFLMCSKGKHTAKTIYQMPESFIATIEILSADEHLPLPVGQGPMSQSGQADQNGLTLNKYWIAVVSESTTRLTQCSSRSIYVDHKAHADMD